MCAFNFVQAEAGTSQNLFGRKTPSRHASKIELKFSCRLQIIHCELHCVQSRNFTRAQPRSDSSTREKSEQVLASGYDCRVGSPEVVRKYARRHREFRPPQRGRLVFEIFAATTEDVGLEDIGVHAQRVEAMGYDGLFVSDAVHDGLLLAARALACTSRIRVAISVLVAFPRSPMNVALAAWDLQKMSRGRFELGLGTQIRQNIEERYSARWLPPAAGMREYVGALRA